MKVEIREERPSALAEYARISIAFEVREVLDVVAPERGLGGLHLVLRPVDAPYVKDYDAEPSQHPTRWPGRFDMERWGVLTAWTDGARVGGTVIAWGHPDLAAEDGRPVEALVYDIRVAPGARGRGVGAALFRAAERWAEARGARRLKVETQNVNVPACRFYARRGCALGGINRFVYPTSPEEVQLLWYKELPAEPDAG